MEEIRREMRALLARTQIRQGVVAEKLGLAASTVSGYLNGLAAMPDGFPERFRAAVLALAEDEAERIRSEAEARAQSLVDEVTRVRLPDPENPSDLAEQVA